MGLVATTPVIAACVMALTVVLGLAMGSVLRRCASGIARREPQTPDGPSRMAHRRRSRAVRLSLAEALCAAIYLSVILAYGLTLEALELLLLTSDLFLVSLVDLRSRTIPNGAIVFALVVRVIYLLVAGALGLVDPLPALAASVLSGLVVFLALLLVVLAADRVLGRQGMGGGDLKLFFLAGLYLGWQESIFLVFLSCLFGIAFALATRQQEGGEGGFLRQTFPFGPSIALAFWAAILWGQPFLAWYQGLLS